ncbi:MAG TPA: sulfotransferase family 2 domain-containing protein, partial [bacterium]|nr:sulfotransferase family 2 domain-containing protein [bacterium]
MNQPASPDSPTNDLWHSIRRFNFQHFRPAKFAALQKKRWAFDQHRCIFVHVPKCAGISLVKSLFGDFDCGHTNLRRYQIMFAPAEFNGYFKFTIVRNPFDRVVSAFLFLKKGGVNEKDR